MPEYRADKGIVATRRKDDVVLNKLLPIAPGIFEFQFMRGGDTDRDRHWARLFRAYVDVAGELLKKDFPAPQDMTPFMMDAVSLDNEGRAFLDILRCIGCGLCASHCSADAISMNIREDYTPPPETPKELREAVMNDFLRVRADEE